MANQNLSEFGEKLFVADADHTFIWDSAASISKRVSRNSWLNSGTLTSDAPVTISQTWGTTKTYTAFKVVANETATAATASNLLELWSGSTAALKLSVRKSGQILGVGGSASIPTYAFAGDAATGIYSTNSGQIYITSNGTPIAKFAGGLTQPNDQPIRWAPTIDANGDVFILRDGAANTLALRNGASAQTFRVYGAYPDTGINYARLALSCDTSGNATISTQALGTYTAGTVSINGIAASSTGTSLTFAGANGIILSQSNYINLQSNAYAAVQALGARGAGNEPSSIACIYGPNSGTIDATSAFKIYRRTGGVDSVPFMVNSAGNVGIGTTSPTSKLQVTNGDVEIETVTSGIIMKAAGTSTRYRITLNATGDALVFTAI